MSVPVFRPSIKRKEMDSVLSCMVSDHIGPGLYSEQLLEQFHSLCNTKSGFLLREYERGIELAFRTLSLEDGAEVILSPLAPEAYFHVIKKMRLKPVFIDVNPATAVPDLDEFMDKINNSTGAVILMGVFGFQWDLSEWDPAIPVIEDITYNFGSITAEIAAGQSGDLVIMRMEPHDLITTGGGSVVLTRVKEFGDKLQEVVSEFDETVILSDMNAALGVSQIKEFEKDFELREEIYQLFLSSLRKGKHGHLTGHQEERIIRASLPVLVKGNRQEVQKYAQKKNVETTLAFRGCCLEEELGDLIFCPVAETLILNCILFPLYPSLGKSNSETIAKVLATLP